MILLFDHVIRDRTYMAKNELDETLSFFGRNGLGRTGCNMGQMK